MNLSITGLRAASITPVADQLDPGSGLSENCSVGSDVDMSLSSVYIEASQGKLDPTRGQTADMEVRYPHETSSNEDCSTSRNLQPEGNKVGQRNRRLGTRERGKRKRWRGRNENLEIVPEPPTGSYKYELTDTDLHGRMNIVR